MNIKLRQLRDARGISQRDFAKIIGKSFRAVQMWERGDSFPNAEMIWRMCEYFGTDPNTFMGWYDEHPAESSPGLTRSESLIVSDYRESTPEGRREIEKYARERRDLADISRQDGGSCEEAV